MLTRQLETLLEGTLDAAFTVDLQGEILTWNKSAERLFGYPASAVVGRNCAEIVAGRIPNGKVCREPCDLLDCIRAGRDVDNYDMEIATASQETVWVNVSLLAAEDGRSGRTLVVHFVRNIQNRKRAEQQTSRILRLAKRLVAAGEPSDNLPLATPLTDQERLILTLLASGRTTSEVAAELQITASTLRNHIFHINKKLRTKNRLQSVMHAMRRGLIPPA